MPGLLDKHAYPCIGRPRNTPIPLLIEQRPLQIQLTVSDLRAVLPVCTSRHVAQELAHGIAKRGQLAASPGLPAAGGVRQ